MKQPFSLAARTFLLSFLSICAVLAAGFFALSAAIKARIKEGLKENLKRTEQQLDLREADYNRRDIGLIGTLSENASLKAAIGLSREQFNPASRTQVRRTIEDQLREMSRGLDYDLFIVNDNGGEVIATVGASIDSARANKAFSGHPGGPSPSLVRLGEILYEVTSVPINLGAENLGRLTVGRRFDLSSSGGFGHGVLVDQSGIVASTLPDGLKAAVERQLSEKCGRPNNGCEIRIASETYLALGMNRAWLGPDYQLLWLTSIDDAMRGFTRGLRRVFIITGLGGVLTAFLFSLLASRSISRPLADLASDLESSGETGALWSEFRVDSSTREVNMLAGALNSAARARRQVEGELRRAKGAAESAMNQVELTYDETLEALAAALDLRDNETAGHSYRVTRYCLEMAKAIGCSVEQLKHIERGAYLHDIGKIGIPDSILLKPGKLTPEEREVIQRHPSIGYELVSRIEFLAPAAEIVLTHQERYDGTGYPQGLAGEGIPLGSRIFAIADTLDAMTSDRPYRKALPLSVALEEIVRESGRQFDPAAVRVLASIPQSMWADIRLQVAGLGGSIASKRAPLQTTVICKWRDTHFRSASLNISESGMLLESPGTVGAGQELELEFSIPQVSEPLRPRAQVIRKEPPDRIGVRFITLTVEARDTIRRYVSAGIKE